MCWPFVKRRGASALSLALLLALSSPALAQQQQPVSPSARVTAQKGRDSAALALAWPGNVKVTEAVVDGQEIKLRFDKPLGTAPIDKIPDLLAGWVDNVLYGYDSVLLVANPQAEVKIEKRANGARVGFSRKPPDKAAMAEQVRADRAAAQRLGYLSASVDLEEGKVRKARAALNGLVQADPRDVQSVRLLASAEERLGRWRESLRLSNHALTFTPGDPDLVRNKARLLHTYGDFVRADYDVFAVRNADTQRVSKLTGRNNLGSDGLLTYAVERRRVDADEVLRPDGVSRPFHGYRSQAAVAFLQDWRNLQATKVSLFAADYTLGGGLSHEWRGDDGVLRFGGNWREPAFSLLEGVVEGGWRSRVFLEWEKRLSQRWSASGSLSLAGYGLDGEDGQLASSAIVSSSLVYILREANPFITLGYALDAEYVRDNKFYYDAFGNPFHPMSLSTREVHSLQASFERALTDYLTWSLYGGWSWDRRSKSAPFASVALRYEPLADLELGLRASRARATGRGTADSVSSAGGYMTWRY